ncbi:kinase-like protein [Melanomma pulvis-pyrius CBS 109.77]|uniref:Kinase-like protein n=1 Tax=Melanomma pulvis-pyrius CBS 109.77 TaxID=1314802 RepID=A0A6A6XNF6_9PLEO|nr:kinase-like protein [Melanomma pulvis-pyrius CBS 109.77]
MSRLNTWFVPAEGIAYEVIHADIRRYLGPDASCKLDELDGVPGYAVTAYRVFTTEMLRDLKADTARWRAEKETILDFERSVLEIGTSCGLVKSAGVFSPKVGLEVTPRGQLGRGSVGVVEEVRYRGASATMARKSIKISPWKTQAARELKMVEHEVNIMASLVHSNIVKVLGYYEDGQGTRNHHFYVLMYPVGDTDLGTFLYHECNGLPPSLHSIYMTRIKKWFYCLASALAYMHSQNVHHEDIKPSNIIHRGEHIFFTDFSSSRKFEAGQLTSTESPARASRLFAAPETLRNNDGLYLRHGSKTDVFSLGLVFLEMTVVLNRGDIGHFRDQLFDDQLEFRQYHRVLDRIRQLVFSAPPGSGFAANDVTHSHVYMKAMLRAERNSRPSALEVDNYLKKLNPYKTQLKCQCMKLSIIE